MKLRNLLIPTIGSPWQGGIYLGIMAGHSGPAHAIANGQPDYHLIAGPEWPYELDWETACRQASETVVAEVTPALGPSEKGIPTYSDFTLPYLSEQSLMFAQGVRLFQHAWYWSCQEKELQPRCALAHFFGPSGGCREFLKGNHFRVRLVRRVPVTDQSLNSNSRSKTT